jgi:hypothetical protein
MTEPLFPDNDATDGGYRNVRAARQHCEELWAVFEPYARLARPKRFQLLPPPNSWAGVGHSLRGDCVRYMFSFRRCRIDPSK